MRLALLVRSAAILAILVVSCGSPGAPDVLSRGPAAPAQSRGASGVSEDGDDGAFDGGDASEVDAALSFCARLAACCAGFPVWDTSSTSCYDIVTGNDANLCKRRWNALHLNQQC